MKDHQILSKTEGVRQNLFGPFWKTRAKPLLRSLLSINIDFLSDNK